jgi:threonylcarbamoyladenosine tRNA methylthiotransferase MtaB
MRGFLYNKAMDLKTFQIITFGCRVNQAESRLIGEKLAKSIKGIKSTKSIKGANLIIINTCCVTHKAEKEVRQAIRKAKRENPNCFLVVAGCLIDKAENSKIPNNPLSLKTLNQADLLLTNKQKKDITKILKKQLSNRTIEQSNNRKYHDKYSQSNMALVKIQEGCDNFCTYCIVPYVRGRSQSRPADKIIAEINQLVKQGIEEVVLTGIDTSSFRIMNNVSSIKYKYKNHLAELIRQILKRTEIQKISFGSININAFDKEFIKLFCSWSGRLTTHFHIPLQSGSDSVLKRMNRRYSVSDFVKKTTELKKKIPKFSLSTDIIVGFPGETSEEFKQTISTIKKLKKILSKSFTLVPESPTLQNRMNHKAFWDFRYGVSAFLKKRPPAVAGGGFTHAHVFRYSSRQGTTATKMLDKKGWGKVPSKEKNKRSRIIRNLIG